MIIVKLMGGLGNQMFQFAFGHYLARKHATLLKADLSFLLNRAPSDNPHFVFRDFDLSIFNLTIPVATEEEIAKFKTRTGSVLTEKLFNRIIGTKKSYIIEEQFHVSEAYLQAANDTYLEGYWQSEQYFETVADELRSSLFTFRNPVSNNAALLLEQIQECNAVCVNVRRGDFVLNPVHGTMGTDYYSTAENLLTERHSDLHYFVFSDDISWCEEHLRFKGPTTFVSHDYAGDKFQDYLRLMSNCKHFIIPNSSFAWWAVWFCKHQDKTVIAPKKWFNETSINTSDLIPSSWIRL